jgi:predicted DNA binding CopG/RHH family protein
MIANLKRYAMRDINLKPMAQQTAVDYLIEELDEQVYRIDHKDNRINISISFEDMMTLKKQAKQMEKEQIVEAFYEGMKTNPFDPNRGRGTMYYNETYKKQ